MPDMSKNYMYQSLTDMHSKVNIVHYVTDIPNCGAIIIV